MLLGSAVWAADVQMCACGRASCGVHSDIHTNQSRPLKGHKAKYKQLGTSNALLHVVTEHKGGGDSTQLTGSEGVCEVGGEEALLALLPEYGGKGYVCTA